MDETNPLRERIENEVVYRVFKVNVPIAVWDEQFPVIDEFCKENFMDNRWTMIWTLVNAEKDDYKFAMMFDRIQELEAQIASLKEGLNNKENEKKPEGLKTFGKRKGETDE